MNHDRFKNKDLLNSQNYVNSKKVKTSLFIEKSWMINKLWIYIFIKLLWEIILKHCNERNKNWIIIIYNIFIVVIWLIIFYYLSNIFWVAISTMIYILVYIHNSNIIITIINWYVNSNYIVLWFRSYESLLKHYSIEDIKTTTWYINKIVSKNIWEKTNFQVLHFKYILKLWIIIHLPIIIYFLEKYLYTFFTK